MAYFGDDVGGHANRFDLLVVRPRLHPHGHAIRPPVREFPHDGRPQPTARRIADDGHVVERARGNHEALARAKAASVGKDRDRPGEAFVAHRFDVARPPLGEVVVTGAIAVPHVAEQGTASGEATREGVRHGAVAASIVAHVDHEPVERSYSDWSYVLRYDGRATVVERTYEQDAQPSTRRFEFDTRS